MWVGSKGGLTRIAVVEDGSCPFMAFAVIATRSGTRMPRMGTIHDKSDRHLTPPLCKHIPFDLHARPHPHRQSRFVAPSINEEGVVAWPIGFICMKRHISSRFEEGVNGAFPNGILLLDMRWVTNMTFPYAHSSTSRVLLSSWRSRRHVWNIPSPSPRRPESSFKVECHFSTTG